MVVFFYFYFFKRNIVYIWMKKIECNEWGLEKVYLGGFL